VREAALRINMDGAAKFADCAVKCIDCVLALVIVFVCGSQFQIHVPQIEMSDGEARFVLERPPVFLDSAVSVVLLIIQQPEQTVRPDDVPVRRRPISDDLSCEVARSFRILVEFVDSYEIRIRGCEYYGSRLIEQGFKVLSVDPFPTVMDDRSILAQPQP